MKLLNGQLEVVYERKKEIPNKNFAVFNGGGGETGYFSTILLELK